MSAQRFELLTKGRTEEAIVADLDKAFGQNVLKETVNELFGRQGAELGLVCAGGAITESDLILLHLDEAAVAEGDAKDVGREILEGGAAVADGLAMHDPVLLPHGRGDARKPIGLAQRIADLGAKEFRERLDREQELFSRGQPCLSVFG